LSLLLGRAPAFAAATEPIPSARPPPLATNLFQLHSLAAQSRRLICSVELDATVCAANAPKDLVVLRDQSTAELLQLELRGQAFSPGQQVRLAAPKCLLTLADCGLKLRAGPVVDNDGMHAMTRRTGTVYLKAGPHPIRLDWFNGPNRYGLAVDYTGPGCPRQPIPDAALFRVMPEPAHGGVNPASGLDYRVYEGSWGTRLPDFHQLTPVKTGTATNFDIGVRTRNEHVGIQFSGFLVVPQDGLYTFGTESDDGSMLYVGDARPQLEVIGLRESPAPRRMAVAQTISEEESGQWAAVEGTVTFVSDKPGNGELELRSESGRMRVLVADGSELSPALLLRSQIRAVGVCQSILTVDGQKVAGHLCVLSGKEISVLEASHPEAEGTLPLLTTVEQVKRLTRDEAQRGYPVRIRGAVTLALPGHNAILIQDSTGGVFVQGVPAGGPDAPRTGECCEIEGVTGPGFFAPVVNSRRASRLGAGRLPDPVASTWDQLMNGSLDTEYVEIQGIVTAVQAHQLELRLRDGKINLSFPDLEPATLTRYENALIRVRGCLFPGWNPQTHRVRVGELTLVNTSFNVDEPAPADLFSTPKKQAAELLLFDLRAGAFQRVRVAGQILAVRAGQYFMADGANGLRFFPKSALTLQPGDLAEVVGFPSLSGPSPILREAVARKIGDGPLPEPRKLESANWLDGEYDATRVRLQGVLVNLRRERMEPVLELQAGLRTLVARLPPGNPFPQRLPVGSRLEAAGVYAGEGGNRALGRPIDSFELLLNSASDIRVLARPPWWTLPRVLAALGTVAAVLLAAMLWALSLRRRVSAQTAVIREKAQREAALEERARIARDIHDDVGSNLTFIMMLGERAREDLARPPELAIHADKIVTYARSTVQALDEIVWAVNPQNDTLDGLVGYLNQYAAHFFESTNLRCRLQTPETLPALALPSEVRHELFLVVKEALNNVFKHSQASEVSVAIAETSGALEIAVVDNGRGFDPRKPGARNGGNGLENMRQRMAGIGGAFCLASSIGQGTTLKFTVRVAQAPRR
jgi:signal transduction histidine kinase